MMVTQEHVDEFKSLYVKASGLGIETDEEFLRLLKIAYNQVVSRTDEFDMDEHPTGRMLVFDAARYIRANASELFYQNYFADLNSFGFELLAEKEGVDDVT